MQHPGVDAAQAWTPRRLLWGGLVALSWLTAPGARAQVAALPQESPLSPRSGSRPAPPPSPDPSIDQPATELPRETPIENSLTRGLSSASGSAFGGYGELVLSLPSNAASVVDLRRVVFFFGHDFSDTLRFYSELEVEHAVASFSDKGEVDVEQAYLDWLFTKRLNLRGGLILMPAGIINIYHEPPSFFAVDRPDVDLLIIPSTWSEPGVGLFGELTEGLRYQLYVVNGLNANRFSAQLSVGESKQEASLAYGGDVGVIGRIDYEPILGAVFGATAYGGTSGNTLTASIGQVPVALFDVDARARHRGWTARFEAAMLLVWNTAALDLVVPGAPVSRVSWGGYAELGYDLFHWWLPNLGQELNLFGRLDAVDTQADVPQGFTPDRAGRRLSGTMGFSYKPIPQIALKLDDRLQTFGAGASFDQLDTAITWLF